MVFRVIGAENMKIYTSRKRNEAGQKAINCLKYCCLPDINETCMHGYLKGEKLTPCIVRFGEVCKHFEGELV